MDRIRAAHKEAYGYHHRYYLDCSLTSSLNGVTVPEDAILCPEFPVLMWFMMAFSKVVLT